jgi:acyl carrier protein
MAQSEQEILEGLAEIVNEETGIETDQVEPDKSFTDDLDIDSLSMMTIVVNAEEKFGVKIPGRRGQEPQHRQRRGQLHRQGAGLTRT